MSRFHSSLDCPTCGGPAVRYQRGSTTLVGYGLKIKGEEDPHEHDDNCVECRVMCEQRHVWMVSPVRTCNDERSDPSACDWTGKTTCDICGHHPKVEWRDGLKKGYIPWSLG